MGKLSATKYNSSYIL